MASNKSSGRRHLALLRGVVLCGLLSASGLVSADLQRGLKNFEDLMAGRKQIEQLSATEVQEVMVVLKAAQRQSAGAADGGHPSYPIEVSHDDGHVQVDVCDRGPGLTDEQRDYAFDRFWRGPGTTGAAGSGLGLAIVRQLAVASGGEVELLGNAGGGIRARVRLVAR